MESMIKERIKHVKKGDQSAFADIVSFYQDKIYRHCYRMLGNVHEAEDIAQEAFVRAYVNIHSYNERWKFSTWLYRIATNLAIDRMRKRKPDYYLDAEVKGTEGLNMYATLQSDSPQPDEQVEKLELKDYIRQEVFTLPPKYRTIITLRYLEEFSLKEIADILDVPLGTVKTRIHRGREALRKKLRHV